MRLAWPCFSWAFCMPTLATIRRPKPPPALLTEWRFELVVALTFAGRATNRWSLNSTRMCGDEIGVAGGADYRRAVAADVLRNNATVGREFEHRLVVGWDRAERDGAGRVALAANARAEDRVRHRLVAVDRFGHCVAEQPSRHGDERIGMRKLLAHGGHQFRRLPKPASKSSRRPMAAEVDSVGVLA